VTRGTPLGGICKGYAPNGASCGGRGTACDQPAPRCAPQAGTAVICRPYPAAACIRQWVRRRLQGQGGPRRLHQRGLRRPGGAGVAHAGATPGARRQPGSSAVHPGRRLAGGASGPPPAGVPLRSQRAISHHPGDRGPCRTAVPTAPLAIWWARGRGVGGPGGGQQRPSIGICLQWRLGRGRGKAGGPGAGKHRPQLSSL
jgi:hypothetical protein